MKEKNRLNYLVALISLFLLVSLGTMNAQNFGDCGYTDEPEPPLTPVVGCENLSDAWLNKYRTPGYWIPDVNTPIKTVLVNYIVLLKDDGTGGWVDSPEFRDEVDLMFENINTWYSNSQQKGYSLTCEPTINYITDTRIRFELNEIIFINNSTFHTAYNPNAIFDWLEENHPDYKKAMNHFFNMPTPNSTPYWGYYGVNGEYDQSYVMTHYSMWSDHTVVWGDHIAHIAHEYGHAVGLHHTYGGEYTEIAHYDFLDDIFGLCPEPNYCSPPLPPTEVCYLKADFFLPQPPQYPLMSGLFHEDIRYISPKYAGRMHRDLSLYDNRFKISNTPMHRYVKEKYSFQTPLTITEDETWDFAIKMYQDIVIEPGNTLTITCTVKMPINGRIIVKQGAILKIDGGTITSAHSSQWQGIEVWGNTTAHQFTINGVCAQGKLIMENGATIENAYNAVTLWKPQDWDARGGIVIANDAVFKNNRRSVEFLKYKNYHPVSGEQMSYISSFTNCEFVVDDDYLAPGGFNAHVTMWGVKGVKINGCAFENKMGINPSDRAIYTVDAGFVIKGACEVNDISPCPTGQYNKTTFDGFYRAIESSNSSNTLYRIYIRESGFSNNGYGIHFSSVNDAVVVGNTFKLGLFDDCNYDAGEGIFLDNCKRFAIENNTFKLPQNAPPAHYIGIHTINTNNAFDEIYKNDFDDMIEANRAEGKNWWKYKETGLAYFCNINQNNSWDFVVEKKDGIYYNNIQLLQGSMSYPAGNTFSSSATKHFYNNGDDEITYYHENGNSSQTPTLLYRVEPEPIQYTNTCPSHYGGGGDVRLSNAEYQQRENDYNSALASYNTASSNYDAANDSTTRSYWAGKMSYYNMQMSRAVYDIIRSDMADTVAHPDKYKTWMNKLNTYASDEAMVDYYLQQGDYTTALNKVDSLPDRFTFTAYDSIEYPMYKDFKHLQTTWLDQGRTVFDLTTAEVNTLIAIADSSKGTAGAQARGILLYAYDSIYSYVNCIGLPGSSNKSAEFNNDSGNKNSELTVNVKPNPAGNSVTFNYALPDNCSTGVVELYNNSGKSVKRVNLTNNGTKTIDCSGLPSGIYFYRFIAGNTVSSGKLVIKH